MIDHDFYENEQRFNERKRKNEENISQYAKNKIKKTVEISIQTAAVGALSDFENTFGYLWKHGKPYKDLTNEEKNIRDKWLDVRDSILERANNGKMISIKDINRCEFKNYNIKRYNTVIRSDKNDRRER